MNVQFSNGIYPQNDVEYPLFILFLFIIIVTLYNYICVVCEKMHAKAQHPSDLDT